MIEILAFLHHRPVGLQGLVTRPAVRSRPDIVVVNLLVPDGALLGRESWGGRACLLLSVLFIRKVIQCAIGLVIGQRGVGVLRNSFAQ